MSYLERLKAAVAASTSTVAPARTAINPSCSSCSTEGKHFSEIDAEGLALPAGELNSETQSTGALQKPQKAPSRSFCSDGGRHVEEFEALAREIATETRLPVSDVLALIDDNDREAIAAGSDPGRVEAWRCAARILALRAEPFTEPTAGTGWPRAVVVWTPAGRPMLAWAKTAEHAERLAPWNPAPPEAGSGGP